MKSRGPSKRVTIRIPLPSFSGGTFPHLGKREGKGSATGDDDNNFFIPQQRQIIANIPETPAMHSVHRAMLIDTGIVIH